MGVRGTGCPRRAAGDGGQGEALLTVGSAACASRASIAGRP